jgi:hypothetical protein
MRRCPGGVYRCAGRQGTTIRTTLERVRGDASEPRFTRSAGNGGGWLLLTAALLACGMMANRPATAAAAEDAPEVRSIDRGSSSRTARNDAIAAIPLDSLAAPQADLVRQTIRSCTLYRRLPTQEFSCHPEMLQYALRHPEAIVDIWRVLDISQLAFDAAGPEQWRLADGYGTVGTLRTLDRRGDARSGSLLLHGRGAYTGPYAPKTLTGNCLILLRYRYADAAKSSDHQVRLQADAFLHMDGIGLEMVTRTLQPLIVTTAGWNMQEICLFMSHFSATAERNPRGVERLAERLTQTDPVHRRTLALTARRAAAGTTAGRHDEGDLEATATRLASRWMSKDQITQEPAARQ